MYLHIMIGQETS